MPRARGGMHIADFHAGHLGANAIVGGSYAMATGAAMGCWKLGLDRVVLCFVGDGPPTRIARGLQLGLSGPVRTEPAGHLPDREQPVRMTGQQVISHGHPDLAQARRAG